VTPDGWAYWEGAFSMLEGKGYRYFSGLALEDWPPLYSLYLAGWMLLLGPSGLCLLLANGALAAVQAAGWVRLGQILAWRDAPEGESRGQLAAAIYVAIFVPLWEGPALAHNLLYAILPFQAIFTISLTRAGGHAFLFLLAVIAASSLIVLAHNSGIVFVAAGAAAVFLTAERGLAARTFLAGLIAALPAGVWYGVRVFLGQEESHPFAGGRFSTLDYIEEGFRGAGKLILPEPAAYGGVLILAGLAVWLFASPRGGMRAFQIFILIAVPFVLLEAIFNITWVYDPLTDARFMLFVPLLIVPAAFSLAKSRVAAFTLSLILLPTLVIRFIDAASFAQRPAFPNAVLTNYVLSRVPAQGQIMAAEQGMLLIGPPRFEWETQEEEGAKDKDKEE
jgi:hypothetical protein